MTESGFEPTSADPRNCAHNHMASLCVSPGQAHLYLVHQYIPAQHKEYTIDPNIRVFRVCKLACFLKFVFNSKSMPLELSWSFAVIGIKNGVT